MLKVGKVVPSYDILVGRHVLKHETSEQRGALYSLSSVL